MASDFQDLHDKVSYDEGEPARQAMMKLYTRVATGQIQHTGSLDIIAFSENELEADWPLWVPDWSKLDGFAHNRMAWQSFAGFDQGALEDRLPYKASGDEKHTITQKDALPGQLACEGTLIGRVGSLGPPADGKISYDTSLRSPPFETLVDAASELSSSSHYYTLCESLCRTLTLARQDNHLNKPGPQLGPNLQQEVQRLVHELQTPSDSRLNHWLQAHRTLSLRGMKISDYLEKFGVPVDQHRAPAQVNSTGMTVFQKQVLEVWLNLGKRFFATEDGCLGMAPANTVRGDEVWALYGGGVLFMLRHNRDGTKGVVGEAYLDKYMEGEAVQEIARGIRTRQVVFLGSLAVRDGQQEEPISGACTAGNR